jgi:serine protease Do
MKTSRFVIFGLVLAGGVALAVSTLVAQDRRAAPRMMMLDGWGRQLGVDVRDLDAEALKGAAGAASGVRIDGVNEGSAAAKAGLREGDIVVEVDGEPVRSARQFSRLIQETPEGRSVKLGVVRNGARQSIEVTPEPRRFAFDADGERIGREVERSLRDLEPRMRELEPRLREFGPLLRERLRDLEPRMREFRYSFPRDFDFDFDGSPRTGRLGVQLSELTPQLAEYFGAKDGGVLVSSVGGDSPAAKAGLKAGDVITSVNCDRVRRTSDLVDALRDNTGELAIGIVRDKKEQSLKAVAR